VLELLTGLGLATSSGLNAYIPLLLVGLLNRYTDLIKLPADWSWLSNGWTLAILAALLAVEMVADKIPVVDHVNDVIQTAVRPTSGGLVFGASASAQTVTVSDPGNFFSNHQWIPVLLGIVISFTVHVMKSVARPIINVSTAGFGAPVASTVEDVISVSMSLIAIVLPFLVLIGIGLLIWWFVTMRRRRKAKKAAARAAKAGARDGTTQPFPPI
jgi:hypothetical protein